MRGQIELPTLGVALLLLTATLFMGITVATDALSAAERSPVERQAAVGLSDQLVSDDSVLTVRENVLEESRLDSFDEPKLREHFNIPPDADVRITLEEAVLLDTGPGGRPGGTSIDRIVLVENRTSKTIQPDFEATRTAILPRRSYNTTITIQPPDGTIVRSVRANDAVILRNESGLVGSFDVTVSPLETTALWFETAGPLPSNGITIDYDTGETRKALLTVRVYE